VNKIEVYTHKGQGYNPFLITEKWQVAQLNYSPEINFQTIDRVERHKQTDEVFILFKGTAILISAKIEEYIIKFELIRMNPGTTYNVPKGLWHSIAMDREAIVIIVENNDTHLHDVEYTQLTPVQKNELLVKIKKKISM